MTQVSDIHRIFLSSLISQELFLVFVLLKIWLSWYYSFLALLWMAGEDGNFYSIQPNSVVWMAAYFRKMMVRRWILEFCTLWHSVCSVVTECFLNAWWTECYSQNVDVFTERYGVVIDYYCILARSKFLWSLCEWSGDGLI